MSVMFCTLTLSARKMLLLLLERLCLNFTWNVNQIDVEWSAHHKECVVFLT